MPIYEYRCTSCNHVFEVSHEVGGQPGPCPNCGAIGTAHRVFTSVGLIFKGSGFHTTDYRKRGAGNGEPAGETSRKESSTKQEKSAEAVTKSDQ
jgi:putative FmdB family regulatory protein